MGGLGELGLRVGGSGGRMEQTPGGWSRHLAEPLLLLSTLPTNYPSPPERNVHRLLVAQHIKQAVRAQHQHMARRALSLLNAAVALVSGIGAVATAAYSIQRTASTGDPPAASIVVAAGAERRRCRQGDGDCIRLMRQPQRSGPCGQRGYRCRPRWVGLALAWPAVWSMLADAYPSSTPPPTHTHTHLQTAGTSHVSPRALLMQMELAPLPHRRCGCPAPI